MIPTHTAGNHTCFLHLFALQTYHKTLVSTCNKIKSRSSSSQWQKFTSANAVHCTLYRKYLACENQVFPGSKSKAAKIIQIQDISVFERSNLGPKNRKGASIPSMESPQDSYYFQME